MGLRFVTPATEDASESLAETSMRSSRWQVALFFVCVVAQTAFLASVVPWKWSDAEPGDARVCQGMVAVTSALTPLMNPDLEASQRVRWTKEEGEQLLSEVSAALRNAPVSERVAKLYDEMLDAVETARHTNLPAARLRDRQQVLMDVEVEARRLAGLPANNGAAL